MRISFESTSQELNIILKSLEFEDRDVALSTLLLSALRGFLKYMDQEVFDFEDPKISFPRDL